MTEKRDIRNIIVDKICGQISDEDECFLEEWVKSSQNHEDVYRRLMMADDLEHRYRQYSDIDEKHAWRKFRRQHFLGFFTRWKRIAAVASVALLATLTAVCFLNREPKAVLPQMQAFEYRQMEMSGREGKQKAMLLMPDKRTVNVKSRGQMCNVQSCELEDGEYQLVTGQGHEFWITLEDGTIVHLNYNTKLKFPAHFSSDSRTVYLDGEAYFKVSKEKNRPFMVVTNKAVVKEYGTEFSVNTKKGEGTEVALVEGKISIVKDNKEYPIGVGEVAEVTRKHINIAKTDLAPNVSWNNGEFVFRNCNLDRLMEVLEQWYGLTVEIESDDLRYMKFSGNIDKYSQVDHLLHAIGKVTGLDIVKHNKKVTIKKCSSYED